MAESALLKNTFKKTLVVLLAAGLLLFSSDKSLARIGEITSCDKNAMPNAYNGWNSGTASKLWTDSDWWQGGNEMQFEMDNPVCIGIAIGAYAAVKAAIFTMNRVCGTGGGIRYTPSILLDLIDVAKASKAAATKKSPACIGAVAGAIASVTTFQSAMAILHGIAEGIYKKVKVCGYDWLKWNPDDMLKNLRQDTENNRGHMEKWVQDRIDNNQTDELNFSHKEYRQYYYNGVEYINHECLDPTMTIDEASNYYGEDDPEVQLRASGLVVDTKFPFQRYYMRGLTADYNCEKYKISSEEDLSGSNGEDGATMEDFQNAYKCCMDTSRSKICIEYDNKYEFCEAGKRCTIDGVIFSAGYEYDNRLICASTYSLCPFNFNIQSGVTECKNYRDGLCKKNGTCEDYQYEMMVNSNQVDCEDEDGNGTCEKLTVESGVNCSDLSDIRNNDCTFNDKANKCQNYCQILNHCVVANVGSDSYDSNISSPYFSSACLDFVGDSKNSYNYQTGIVAGNQQHFTAPIVQCVRETIENVFYNIAGHSKCANSGDIPDKYGNCRSSSYIYKEGESLSLYPNLGDQYNQSFFSRLQDRVRDLVRLLLTIYVAVTGIGILTTGKHPERKQILGYVIKVGLVLFFATGTAWQNFFFDGVYSASEVISQVTFKIKVDENPDKRDGCQFGDVYIENGTYEKTSTAYPKNKEYLAVWDTLDCKIARYLGFGPTADVASLTVILLALAFTGALGVYFIISLLVFGFFLIIAAVRAVHIFLTSAISIIIMVYVSPIIIPSLLFKRTEGIFKNWLNNLISFSLQPIILFAYIGLFVTIFDQLLIGSAEFKGPSPQRILKCDRYCIDSTTGKKAVVTDENTGEEVESMQPCYDGEEGYVAHYPGADSVACIINFDWDIKSYKQLSQYGINIPVIFDDEFNEQTVTRMLTLLKAVLLIYILAAFIDEIPGISSGLTGGSELPGGGKMSIESMVGTAASIGKGAGKRTFGFLKKNLPKAMEKGKLTARALNEARTAAMTIERELDKSANRHMRNRRNNSGGSGGGNGGQHSEPTGGNSNNSGKS